MKRKVFYSFHYKEDNWRTGQVRSIGAIEGNEPVSDNDWEEVTKGGDKAIEEWIDDQMIGRSCVVVLVGAKTAGRKWINYEIEKAWNEKKGVVGIRIHGLKDLDRKTSQQGANPFDYISFKDNKDKKLSSIVKCYNPSGSTSTEKYAWIKDNLSDAVEEAIEIRKNHG